MDSTTDIMSSTEPQSIGLFHSFHNHCSQPRVDTDISILQRIRNAHPEYHVTAVDEQRCSLGEFSKAGKAERFLDTEGENFHGLRGWISGGGRLEKKRHPGELRDHLRFARYKYTWDGKVFLVYKVTWRNTMEAEVRNFYILYPRTESNIVSGRCVQTEALILACGKWTSELHEEIFVFDDGYWTKNKELYTAVRGASWDDVILDPEMKKNIMEDVQGFFDSHKLYDDFMVPWKRGIILHGTPGNGKTASIKALINSLYERPEPIPSLYVKSFDSCKGEYYAIRSIFKQARNSAPCLLIFEDLDSLLVDEVRSYFLNEVDGLESNDGILMIGSTNHLDRLDPAIAKRPSRFDRKYHFKLPNQNERAAYAEYWRQKLLKNTMIEFPQEVCEIIGKLTEGFSFAYLKELFVMTMLTLARGFNEEDLDVGMQEEKDVEGDAEVKSETSLEIVNKEEAVEPSPPSSTSDAPSSQPTCICKADLIKLIASEIEKANSGNSEASKADDKKEEKPKEHKLKMPVVEVPENLEGNLLLKVVKRQIVTLIQEMDNTDEDEWPSSKKQMGGGGSRRRSGKKSRRNC